MRLIKHQKLHYLDEKSDKVYEVELFEIQPGEFIVNFKYGRRGNRLQEGTKTVFPVPFENADKVYSALINSKTKKGYQEVIDYESSTPTISIKEDVSSASADKVMEYLSAFATDKMPSTNWKTSRIIWRAGELKLEPAIEPIAKIISRLDGQDKYAAVWALGHIGHASGLSALKSSPVQRGDLWERIYYAALINCGDDRCLNEVVKALPGELKAAFDARDEQVFEAALGHYLFELKANQIEFLIQSYYISVKEQWLRRPIGNALSRIEIKADYWKYLRYIYKVAEMVGDGETFGLLAMRILNQSPRFQSHRGRIFARGQMVDVSEELGKHDTIFAFSSRTRHYFINRTLRRLRKSGIDRLENYCAYATGILTNIKQSDLHIHPPDSRYEYDQVNQRYTRKLLHFTNTAHIPFIYYILHAQGTRLQGRGTKKFNFEGEIVSQTEREDSFPSLWDRYPQYVVKCLVKGRVDEVIGFALRFLKARSDLGTLVSLEILVELMTHPSNDVLNFGLELVRDEYDAKNPAEELLMALVNTSQSAALDLAYDLLLKNEEPYINNIAFAEAILKSEHEPLNNWLREHFDENSISEGEKNSLIGSMFLFYEKLENDSLLPISVTTLVTCLKASLGKQSIETIERLLNQKQLQLQLLAGKLLEINERPISEIPDGFMINMIESEHSEIRAQGLKIMERLDDQALMMKKDFFIHLATHEKKDLRQRSGVFIGRLAAADPVFRDKIYLHLYPFLMENSEDEDLPFDIYSLIENHLEESLPLALENIDEIIKDNHRETHLMTEKILIRHVELDKWPVYRIALLANHDMLSIRQMAFDYFEQHADRMKYEREVAVKIFESDWPETQAFARNYFDTHFGEEDWTPELIIQLCDNVRHPVQQYGTGLLGKYFKEENGLKYLTALSEHPEPSIQLYTTNYLDNYAFNRIEILAKLDLYFKRILTSINKNSAAKKRAYHFLEKQAKEGPTYAAYVSKILNDVSGTISIMDKAKCIRILYAIRKQFPNIENQVNIIMPESKRTA